MFDQPVRPRRRARRLVWVVLIATGVVVSILVSSAGESSRAELEYLETLRTQAAQLSRDGEALRDVVDRLGDIERVELETMVETIEEDLAGAAVFASQEAPSLSLTSIRATYRLAVDSWYEGLQGLSNGLLTAADNPDNALALDTLANAIADLRAGDALYSVLVEEVSREDTPSPVAPMPGVRLSPRSGPLATVSALLVSAAAAHGGLGSRPGLALSQILSDPGWQVNPSGQAVVPTTSSITFSVVITNLGNVTSDTGSVTLILSSADDTKELSATFEALDANEQLTIVFDTLEVTPGGAYQVEASLITTNPDSDLTDNVKRVQFNVNE